MCIQVVKLCRSLVLLRRRPDPGMPKESPAFRASDKMNYLIEIEIQNILRQEQNCSRCKLRCRHRVLTGRNTNPFLSRTCRRRSKEQNKKEGVCNAYNRLVPVSSPECEYMFNAEREHIRSRVAERMFIPLISPGVFLSRIQSLLSAC